MKIVGVRAMEIFDSRFNPTVRVLVKSKDLPKEVSASVPSGASTGTREALELRDGGKRLFGKGVQQAVDNVNKLIAPRLIGMDFTDQRAIDEAMIALDGTPNKSKLGANAILGVSMAVAKAAAELKNTPLYKYLGELNPELRGKVASNVLPTPMVNVINGGEHANNSLDLQEIMIMPVGAKSFKEAMEMNATVFHTLKKLADKAGFPTSVGDEGGFAPNFATNEEAFKFVTKAIDETGLTGKVKIAIDAAASEFFQDGKYHFDGKQLSSQEMVDYYKGLTERYPIVSLEDGMSEADDLGWKLLTDALGKEIQIVGDDLFVTQAPILKEKGLDKGVANSVLVKVNQVGSVSETLDTMKLAKDNGYTNISSHRSGETGDTFISDLAVGTNAGQIKTGASRGERLEKYNRLLEIEEELGADAQYLGSKSLNGNRNKELKYL